MHIVHKGCWKRRSSGKCRVSFGLIVSVPQFWQVEDTMPFWRRLSCFAALVAAMFLIAACTVQLVAPFNADLQQKASTMQAEVGTWDLAMHSAAGTTAADPRHPDVTARLDKWRGEADAMLTLTVSGDPGLVNCSAAVKAVQEAIFAALPPDVRAAQQANAAAADSSSSSGIGCESTLAASLGAQIEEIRAVLAAGCKLDWIDDAWFAALAQNGAAASKPPAAPQKAQQDGVSASCRFEFTPLSRTPANAAGAGHGPAVSRLLRSLQAIVYVETRKKASAASK